MRIGERQSVLILSFIAIHAIFLVKCVTCPGFPFSFNYTNYEVT